MGRVAGKHRRPDGEAIDALGWSAADLLDEPGSPIGAVEADDLAGQVDPLAWFDLVGRAHVPSPVVVCACPLDVVRRWRLIGSRTWVDRAANISAMTVSDAAAVAFSVTDPAAFAAIFDRHAASIHRFLARRVEPAEAESLLGEVFRVAFERRETFDLGRASARPWLYGIATNLIARHRRSEAHRLRAMASLASMRVEGAEDAVDDRAAEVADAGESWATVVDAIDQLPDAERDTLMLFAWEELSYDDIAAALDVPVGTVRSRLNRARRRLRAARAEGIHDPRPITAGTDDHDTEDPAR